MDGFFFDMADSTCIIIFNIEDMFSIYLAEIACSQMAAIVDPVDLSRVEDLIHWLDYSLST